jgi:hypothetical protein
MKSLHGGSSWHHALNGLYVEVISRGRAFHGETAPRLRCILGPDGAFPSQPQTGMFVAPAVN